MMVQQFGCFDVVECGFVMQNIQQEWLLVVVGEMCQEFNIGKGQMQVVDFVMMFNVQVGVNISGGLGGFFGGKLGIIGVIVGGLKFKDVFISLMLVDVCFSIQVVVVEGKVSKMDFFVGGWGFGGGVVGGLGGYMSMVEGKLIVVSFFDNYNKIVQIICDQGSLICIGSVFGDVNVGVLMQVGVFVLVGQMLMVKIFNVKVYVDVLCDSKVVVMLNCSDELVVIGEVKDGFVKVDVVNFSGWVQCIFVMLMGC